jgi:hypothetical protein
MTKIAGGFDPRRDSILGVGDSFRWRFSVTHTAGQVRRECHKTSPVFSGERLDNERVFKRVHARLRSLSIKATSFLIYMGLIGLLYGIVNFSTSF